MQEQINEIQAGMQRIEDAIAGNNLGNKGLAQRIEENEILAEKNKKAISSIKSMSALLGTGAGTGISAVFLGLKAWWVSKFG